MRSVKRVGTLAGLAGVALLFSAGLGIAQEEAVEAVEIPAVSSEVAFIFNTFLFLVCGFLVMWMAAGFAMLEVGLVRSRNAATICVKNIALFSIAGLMYWLVGYNLMYGLDGGIVPGVIGSIMPWSADDSAALDTGYAAGSDWFFQMVFCATAASIVSGTLAERIRLWPFLIFVTILTGIMYPITGSWEWGGGWLDAMGFSDFAGSTLVHSVGGWAALSGAVILGSRVGKFGPGGAVNPMPGSSLPLATLGTLILWLGWFGFNGGSQLALGSMTDAIDISAIFINTNMAAAAGVVGAMIFTQIVYRKVDLTMALNGAIAGLVAITAEPLTPAIWQACVIGAIGGILASIAIPLLDKLRIDDVVGAISAHLVAGIFGTLVVSWTNTDVPIVAQATGVIAIGAFTLIVSSVIWFVLKFTIGIRASDADQERGLDETELGQRAYPEFSIG